MRSMRAARCNGASAVTGIIVVQFGHDAMPFGMLRMSSGFTSATTSGTSGSMRNAAELSIDLRAGRGRLRRPLDARSARRRRRSRGRGRRSSPARKHLARDLAAVERRACGPPSAATRTRAARRPGTRAPRGSAASRCRPSRSHPSRPISHDRSYSQSSVEPERGVQRLHRRARRRPRRPRTRSEWSTC